MFHNFVSIVCQIEDDDDSEYWKFVYACVDVDDIL